MSRAYRHDARTRPILGSLATLLCPPEVAPDLVEPVVDDVELTMQAMPAAIRTALRAGLVTYELGAVARWGRPASKLAPERAARYLDAWRHGRPVQRELIKAVRSLVCLAYFELPAVKQRMGYLPERWIEQVKHHRLATYGEDIARHAARLFELEPLPRLSVPAGDPGPGPGHGHEQGQSRGPGHDHDQEPP
ncbi:MAG TPA: hypothetical protein VNM90_15765 [Haliangium sp.]|nr:hypothetical protein [Haliangium sp.]